MGAEIVTKIVVVKDSDKAGRLLSNQEATSCDVPEGQHICCTHFDWKSHKPIEGPHGETMDGTVVGKCKLTNRPCLKMAEVYDSTMLPLRGR